MHRAIAIAALLLPLGGHAGELKEALDRAWALDAEGRALDARRAEVEARRQAADGLLPAPPALVLGHRSDALNRDDGSRETEAELEFPVWLPGQRTALREAAGAELNQLEAALAARRLEVARSLREAAWAAASAAVELRLAERRTETAARLEQDVARRVAAGELARTDLLLAGTETSEARAETLEAELRREEALRAYRALSGGAEPPAYLSEAAASAELDAHPKLAAARAAIALAQARARVARESRREAPELGVGARRERGAYGEPWEDSIQVRLRLPFATEARNAPLLAEAEAGLTAASAEHTALRIRVRAEIESARLALETARRQLELARGREAQAAEHLMLQEKAFRLGEIDLVGYLRAQSLAREASLRLARRQVAAERARAFTNQALGVLP